MKEQVKLALACMLGMLCVALVLSVVAYRYEEDRRRSDAAEEYHALCQEVKRLRGDVAQLKADVASLKDRLGKLGDVNKINELFRRFEHWEKFGVLSPRR